MTTDIKQTDFVSYAEDLLPQQFDKADNTKALLEIFLTHDQEFQDEIQKLFNTGIDIDSAYGYQLEILGKLSGLQRTDPDDEVYRNDIKFKQTIDNSSGTIPEITAFVKTITALDDVNLIPNYPAAFVTQIIGGASIPLDTADKISGVTGSGINAHSVIHLEDGYGLIPCEIDDYLYNYNAGTGEFDEILEGDLNWRSVLVEIGEEEVPAKKGKLGETYTSKGYV